MYLQKHRHPWLNLLLLEYCSSSPFSIMYVLFITTHISGAWIKHKKLYRSIISKLFFISIFHGTSLSYHHKCFRSMNQIIRSIGSHMSVESVRRLMWIGRPWWNIVMYTQRNTHINVIGIASIKPLLSPPPIKPAPPSTPSTPLPPDLSGISCESGGVDGTSICTCRGIPAPVW